MITFGFLDCPLCKKRISHLALKEDLKPVTDLFEDIRTKAVQRVKFMNLEGADELKDKNSAYFNNLEKYAFARLCYYPCFKCKVRVLTLHSRLH